MRHTRVSRRDKARDSCVPRDVVQFQYTSWPDHGTPGAANITPVLSFIKKSSAVSAEAPDSGPVKIHLKQPKNIFANLKILSLPRLWYTAARVWGGRAPTS